MNNLILKGDKSHKRSGQVGEIMTIIPNGYEFNSCQYFTNRACSVTYLLCVICIL